MKNEDLLKTFKFYVNSDYPSGSVSIDRKNVEMLKEHGWIVDYHTDQYLNFIGVEFNGVSIGFGGWMESLSPIMGENDYFKISSEETLNNFIELVESLNKLSKNYGN